MGNVHKDSLESLWNSSHFRKIREDMILGRRIPDCQYCYDMENRGAKSSRQWANERYFNSQMDRSVQFSMENQGQMNKLPDSLELRLSNYCNLKCHSCWSLSSSQLSSEREQWLKDKGIPDWLKRSWLFEKEKTNFPSIRDLPEGSLFEKSFKNIAPGLKRIYISGGEPTLIRAYEKILKHLVSIGNTDLELSLTINLTKVSKGFLSLLQKFSNVEVSCSIDGFQLANNYIRYPSKWPVISRNFKTLRENLPQANIVIYSVYSIYNSFSLIDLCKWVEDLSPSPPALCISWLRHPEYLRVENLPKHLKNQVLRKWNRFMKNRQFKNSLTKSNMENLSDFITKEPEEKEKLFNQFLSYTKFADRKRNINLKDYIPELEIH